MIFGKMLSREKAKKSIRGPIKNSIAPTNSTESRLRRTNNVLILGKFLGKTKNVST